MTAIPRDTAFDSTLALLRDGYEFISRRCDRFGTDIFATRIMLRRAVCLRGAAAAEMFYGSECFTRQGAMPWTTLRLLQGKRSVQQLEGPAHRRRKAMFLSLLREQEKLESMRRLFTQEWLRALESWKARDEIVLFDEAQLVLTRAACAWAGIPPELHDPEKLCREFGAMIENAGSVGPATLRALLLRKRTERWARSLIRRVRSGDLVLPGTAPLRIVAEHRDADRKQLDVSSAAVEVINLLRPIVAVARYIMFAAMALRDRPEWQVQFAAGDERHLETFA
ncbi:hypothetical protein [Ensifer aridi]|uniref:hypothetical protein n=1 Tax=Ensifer aridi TaxID=1708715 RepID=UPI000421D8A8|nr:hypothetical protein [Ensifer aridi]